MRRALALLVVTPLVAVAAGGAWLSWRLSRGPIPLDFLRPRIESALAGESFHVTIGGIEVEWAGAERGLELRARDVAALGAAGETIASVPELAVEIDPAALLDLRIGVLSIEAIGPSLRLVRKPDGDIDLGLGGPATTPGASDAVGTSLLEQLGGERAAGGAVSDLARVQITRATVVLENEESGDSWNVPDLDVTLTREPGGIVAAVAGRLELGEATVPVQGQARLHLGAAGGPPTGLDADVAARGVRPSAIAAQLEEQPWTPVAQRLVDAVPLLRRVDVALDVQAAVALDASWEVSHLSLNVTGGAGTVAVTPRDHLPVRSLAVELEIDGPTDRVELKSLTADLAGPQLSATGGLSGLAGPGHLELAADLTRIPVSLAWRLWPQGTAESARKWLSRNIPEGHVPALRVELGGAVEAGSLASFASPTLSGSLSYEGLQVRFLDTMPPLRAVSGKGSFTAAGWKLAVAGGRIESLELGPTSVSIDRLDTAKPAIALQASLRGPVRDALRVLDRPPVEVGKRAGFAVDTASGALQARLSLGFPLTGVDPGLGGLGLAAHADLTDVALPDVVGNWSVRAGRGALDVDARGLAFAGTVDLAGVPLAVTWNESFDPKAAPQRTIEARGSVDADGRRRFGVDLGSQLEGPVGVQISLSAAAGKPTRGDAEFDLSPATVDVPAIAWKKLAGAPGQARARLTIRDGALASIDSFSVDAGNLDATGSATAGAPEAAWKSISVDARLERAGKAAATGRASVRLTGEGKAYRFRITSNDSGALFRAMGNYTNAVGGELTVDGKIDPSSEGTPLSAHADVLRFTITGAPWLVRLAGLASLGGIQGALSGGSGVAFDGFSIDLTRRDRILTITSARAAGPVLGLTIAGTIDQGNETVDLRGTLIPSLYGINSMLEKIPVIRWVAGPSHPAPIGMDFSLQGSAADPKVAVHPLDSITPDIVKNMLDAVTGAKKR